MNDITSIIIPTYNEAANIPIILPKICETLEKEKINYEILVVDDDSKDNTEKAVLKESINKPIRFISRAGKERGLSISVMEGFQKAQGSIYVIMDADLSHPIETLPNMIRPIAENKKDICIGSRFIKGGGIKGWPWYRKVISKSAAILSYGVCKIKDPTSGYMAVRKETIKNKALNPISWKIVLEIICKCPNARKEEIPIIFKDRTYGQSKLTIKEQYNYIKHLKDLYVHKYKLINYFIKFSLVGFIGLIVDMGIFAILFNKYQIDIRLATSIAFSIAVTNNYLLNKRWTFKNRCPYNMKEYGSFIMISLTGLSFRLAIMQIALILIININNMLGLFLNLIGISIATIINFIGSHYLLEKKEIKNTYI
ncbi:MAG: glycosyltransferase family 2 protein [bacterium]